LIGRSDFAKLWFAKESRLQRNASVLRYSALVHAHRLTSTSPEELSLSDRTSTAFPLPFVSFPCVSEGDWLGPRGGDIVADKVLVSIDAVRSERKAVLRLTDQGTWR